MTSCTRAGISGSREEGGGVLSVSASGLTPGPFITWPTPRRRRWLAASGIRAVPSPPGSGRSAFWAWCTRPRGSRVARLWLCGRGGRGGGRRWCPATWRSATEGSGTRRSSCGPRSPWSRASPWRRTGRPPCHTPRSGSRTKHRSSPACLREGGRKIGIKKNLKLSLNM